MNNIKYCINILYNNDKFRYSYIKNSNFICRESGIYLSNSLNNTIKNIFIEIYNNENQKDKKYYAIKIEVKSKIICDNITIYSKINNNLDYLISTINSTLKFYNSKIINKNSISNTIGNIVSDSTIIINNTYIELTGNNISNNNGFIFYRQNLLKNSYSNLYIYNSKIKIDNGDKCFFDIKDINSNIIIYNSSIEFNKNSKNCLLYLNTIFNNTVNITLINSIINGNIIGDGLYKNASGYINIYLKNNSKLIGEINSNNKIYEAIINIDNTSKWINNKNSNVKTNENYSNNTKYYDNNSQFIYNLRKC